MKNFLFALIIMTTIFFAGCSNDEPPVEVKVAKVSAVDGTLTVTHDGKISLSNEIQIHSKVTGTVIATYFDGGQDVTEGQLLFKIGNRKDEAQLLQTKAALGESMTALAKELAELSQAEMRLKQNPDAAQEVADKKSAVAKRQAEISERQELVQKLEAEDKAGEVFSPKSGQIGIMHAQIGDSVLADETNLASIGNINPAVVCFEVSAEEKNLLMSDALKVTLKLTDGTIYPHEGKIHFADNATAEAIFDNPDGLLTQAGAVQVVIDGLKVPKSLLVPENAIQQRDGGDFVVAVDSDKNAAVKKILLGDRIGTYFVVKDGLKADDLVVVEGSTNLRDGTPLKLVVSD